MDRRRIILLILFSLGVLVLGYILFLVFFAPRDTQPPGQPGGTGFTGEPGTFPSAGEGDGGQVTTGQGSLPTGQTTGVVTTGGTVGSGIEEQIVTAAIGSPTLDSAGRLVYYNEQDGKFYRINADGTITVLSDQVFFQADNVVWNPTQNEAIIEYPDGANIYFNFDTNEQVTLPQHWEEFSFSPQGDEIAAKSIALAPENRWLMTASPDGSNVSLIESLGSNADKVTVDWSPNRQVVAFSETGESLGIDRQDILLVGLQGENFKSLTVEGRGFESEWSPTGSQLIYSVYSERSDFLPELWVVNAGSDTVGTGLTPLGVNTWADKCTFGDDRFVYCGVPTDLPRGAGFAPEVAATTPDLLYKIDTQTGIQTIIETDQSYVVDSLILSDDGQTLYLTDPRLNGLFAIDI